MRAHLTCFERRVIQRSADNHLKIIEKIDSREYRKKTLNVNSSHIMKCDAIIDGIGDVWRVDGPPTLF